MSLIVRVIARDGATPALCRVDLDPSQVADAKQKNRAKEDEDSPLPCGQHPDDDREEQNNDRCGEAEHTVIETQGESVFKDRALRAAATQQASRCRSTRPRPSTSLALVSPAAEAIVLVCLECGAEAEERAAGWRAYLTDDEDEPAEVGVYCSECADREFGTAGQ